jgi:hypothetical protein
MWMSRAESVVLGGPRKRSSATSCSAPTFGSTRSRPLSRWVLVRARPTTGSAMFVKLAHFLNIMLYALVAGVMWGTWLSLGRTMTEYDAATFLADGKHMITNLATIMPV